MVRTTAPDQGTPMKDSSSHFTRRQSPVDRIMLSSETFLINHLVVISPGYWASCTSCYLFLLHQALIPLF